MSQDIPRVTGKTVITYNIVMEYIKNNGNESIQVNIDGVSFTIHPSTTLDEYREYIQISKKHSNNIWTEIKSIEEKILNKK